MVVVLLNISLSGVMAQPTNGLVMYYPFDDDEGGVVTDESGQGNDATYVSATHVPESRFDGSYFFNGAGGRIETPDSPSLRLQEMTMSLWVKPALDMDVPHANRTILSKEAQGWSGGYDLAHGGGGPHINFKIMGSGYHNTIEPMALDAGTWYHIAGTYDGSVRGLYINGVAVESITQSVILAHNAEPLQIGARAPGSHSYWHGEIDEVRMYSRGPNQGEKRGQTMNSRIKQNQQKTCSDLEED